eukprot:GHVU01115822.1.p1 GENE.GHVU01115822.1~~GHVU01115822.1.p1  ORF type:complete len:269 (-),score=16.91 GHVU01115822.1:434-1192(-)
MGTQLTVSYGSERNRMFQLCLCDHCVQNPPIRRQVHIASIEYTPEERFKTFPLLKFQEWLLPVHTELQFIPIFMLLRVAYAAGLVKSSLRQVGTIRVSNTMDTRDNNGIPYHYCGLVLHNNLNATIKRQLNVPVVHRNAFHDVREDLLRVCDWMVRLPISKFVRMEQVIEDVQTDQLINAIRTEHEIDDEVEDLHDMPSDDDDEKEGLEIMSVINHNYDLCDLECEDLDRTWAEVYGVYDDAYCDEVQFNAS